MVDHTYSPSHSGGGRYKEDHKLGPGVVNRSYHPS